MGRVGDGLSVYAYLGPQPGDAQSQPPPALADGRKHPWTALAIPHAVLSPRRVPSHGPVLAVLSSALAFIFLLALKHFEEHHP